MCAVQQSVGEVIRRGELQISSDCPTHWMLSVITVTESHYLVSGAWMQTGLTKEQQVAFRTKADTMVKLQMWVLSKHDFRSRKLFDGDATKELPAKNIYEQARVERVIPSCLFYNYIYYISDTREQPSESSTENAGGFWHYLGRHRALHKGYGHSSKWSIPAGLAVPMDEALAEVSEKTLWWF